MCRFPTYSYTGILELFPGQGHFPLLADLRPDAIIQFAEHRAAPYSMKDAAGKIYTVNNNINATHNLLVATTELGLDAHIVHLGTMGVYGYDGDGLKIPEPD
ncbi:hypothetical protein PSAL_032410 [Pseudooceanicola algae]|uniref:NAD-dependent epimerase/dehydratase domain-containing protein n=1 Tax=Pseudooceanicola algae TaxID=1537215 RepID=A0A418SJ37_9RHOB|nr:hypothetical protein PSAL_032410 [Pseudooceanicola algae]